jgi:hypothetical protein
VDQAFLRPIIVWPVHTSRVVAEIVGRKVNDDFGLKMDGRRHDGGLPGAFIIQAMDSGFRKK